MQPEWDDPEWYREDGTKKGMGFLGALPTGFPAPDGMPPREQGVATEFSVAQRLKDANGQWLDYPALVPTLTPDEVAHTMWAINARRPLPPSVMKKAEAFALQRRAQGQPVFAKPDESPLRIGDTLIPQPPMAVSHEPTIRDLIAERFPQFAKALDGLNR
jgi:hypothetical protein